MSRVRESAGRSPARFARLIRRVLPPICVVSVVAALYLAGGLEFLERRWMDLKFKLSTRVTPADVVLVDIDPRSLQALQAWPWPRDYHCTVIENLLAAGPRRVGL